jgi:light-independent protochlorophyllide reductase subunit B
MYPEIASQAAQWLQRNLKQPMTKTVPIGVGATCDFVREVAALAGVDPEPVLSGEPSRATWYARSVDSTYLTGKRVFVFGDATHAIAAARIASRELGFEVVGLGTYSREFAREIREAAKSYGVEALITDDYLEVEARVAELQPELVLGTQMERHIAKRLGLPCAVISAPVHVQDFPARYAPQMGFEGANVLFDTWVQPLMMGLEEHLLTMFRGDFEFHEDAAPSHLGRSSAPASRPAPATATAATTRATGTDGPAAAQPEEGDVAVVKDVVAALAAHASAAVPAHAAAQASAPAPAQAPVQAPAAAAAVGPAVAEWSADGLKELQKIPFFVRGKARRNTERFALEHGVSLITVETLYDAKSYFSR